MKAKHLITTTMLATLMMGGSMSPLYAQETATITATCADNFTAAAYLPAEMDSFITLNAAGMLELAKKVGLPEEEIPAELAAIESVALGLPAGWEHLYEAYGQIAGLLYQAIVEEGIKTVWADMADAAIAPILRQGVTKAGNPVFSIVETVNNISQPAYAVLRVKPGQEQLLSDISVKLTHGISHLEVIATPGCEPYRANGWSGVSINIAAVVEHEPIPAEYKEAVKQIKPFYCVYRVEGNALIFALCDDTAKLKVCTSAAESVLSTPKAAFMQNMEPHQALVAGSTAPALLNSTNSIPLVTLNAAIAPIRDALNRIAEECPQMQAEMKSGAASLQQIVTELSKLMPASNCPLTLKAWHDGDLHLSIEGDAYGDSFTTATVNTAGKEEAAVYLYGSTLKTPNLPNLDTTVNCVFDVVNTYAYTLPADAQSEVLMQLGSARMVYAMLPGMLAPVKKMVDSLGNGWCVTLGRAESEGSTEPYVGMSINVADRDGLASGWKGTVNTIAGVVGMVAPEDANLIQDAIAEVEEKQLSPTATMYGHNQSPAAVVLSDSELIIGSDFRYAGKIAAQPRTESISGIKMGFRLAPFLQFNCPPQRTCDEAGVQALVYKACCEQILSIVTGGTLYLTVEDGKMKLNVDITTPGLR